MDKQAKIVVLTQGFVVAGLVEEHTTGALTIYAASVIRLWGTTKGLGELAFNGPTQKTVLDPAGIVDVPSHAVVMQITIKSDPKLWGWTI